MKKRLAMTLLLAMLSGGAAWAQEQLYLGWLGLGLATGGFSNFKGTQLNPIETGKITAFLGVGAKVLPPLPIYMGFEFNLMIAKVGEESETALVFKQQLIDLGTGYFLYQKLTQGKFSANYWDIDLSPRLTGVLALAQGLVAGTVFVGANFNYLTMDWEWDSDIDTPPNPEETGNETLAGPVIQGVVGLRVSALFFYMDYTRYFNLQQTKVDTTKIAGNRLSLGVHLTF